MNFQTTPRHNFFTQSSMRALYTIFTAYAMGFDECGECGGIKLVSKCDSCRRRVCDEHIDGCMECMGSFCKDCGLWQGPVFYCNGCNGEVGDLGL